MVKFNFKKLVRVGILGLFLFATMGVVNTQRVLAKGGDSFATAVKLEPGNYQGGSVESKEAEYFYVTGIQSRQEISVKGTFTAASSNAGAEAVLVLYDKNKTKLAEKVEAAYETVSLTVSSLHSGRETDKYYIKAGSGLFDIESYSLAVTLTAAPTTSTGKATVTPTVVVGALDATPTGSSNLVLILGVVFVVVILGIVVYFLLRKKQ